MQCLYDDTDKAAPANDVEAPKTVCRNDQEVAGSKHGSYNTAGNYRIFDQGGRTMVSWETFALYWEARFFECDDGGKEDNLNNWNSNNHLIRFDQHESGQDVLLSKIQFITTEYHIKMLP